MLFDEMHVFAGKICSRLEVPQNGRFTCSDGNFFSSTCTYQCSEGFRLSHNYSLNCTGDGWDRGAPVCQRKLILELETFSSLFEQLICLAILLITMLMIYFTAAGTFKI